MEPVVGEEVLDSIDVVKHMFLVNGGTGGRNGVGSGNNDGGYQRDSDVEDFVTLGGLRGSIRLKTPYTSQRKGKFACTGESNTGIPKCKKVIHERREIAF